MLTSLAAVPFLLSFAFSPRRLRHPYLLYTSILAILSTAAPMLLAKPTVTPRVSNTAASKKLAASRARLDASYEVLGDNHSEAASEEDALDDTHAEQVRAATKATATAYIVRAGLSTVAFVLAVVGIWGDGVPRVVAA